MEDRTLSDEILLGLIKKAGGDVSKVAAEVAAIKDGASIDSFADVETALSGKADNDIVADAFSAAETYAAGDYCTYEGGLYKFKTAHEGAWDAADVDQIKIAGELSELKNTLTWKTYPNSQVSWSGTNYGDDQGYQIIVGANTQLANANEIFIRFEDYFGNNYRYPSVHLFIKLCKYGLSTYTSQAGFRLCISVFCDNNGSMSFSVKENTWGGAIVPTIKANSIFYR